MSTGIQTEKGIVTPTGRIKVRLSRSFLLAWWLDHKAGRLLSPGKSGVGRVRAGLLALQGAQCVSSGSPVGSGPQGLLPLRSKASLNLPTAKQKGLDTNPRPAGWADSSCTPPLGGCCGQDQMALGSEGSLKGQLLMPRTGRETLTPQGNSREVHTSHPPHPQSIQMAPRLLPPGLSLGNAAPNSIYLPYSPLCLQAASGAGEAREGTPAHHCSWSAEGRRQQEQGR